MCSVDECKKRNKILAVLKGYVARSRAYCETVIVSDHEYTNTIANINYIRRDEAK